MKIHFKISLIVLLIAVILSCAEGGSAAPSTDAQLDAIAKARDVWSTALAVRQTAEKTFIEYNIPDTVPLYFAVADINGNGRLELLFSMHVLSHKDTENAKQRGASPELIRMLEQVAAVPVNYGVFAFELDENNALVPLSTVFTKGYNAAGGAIPDLTQLRIDPDLGPDGPYYYLATYRRNNADVPYPVIVSYLVLVPEGSTLHVYTQAQEYLSYIITDDESIPGEVSSSVIIYDRNGNPTEMSPEEFYRTEIFKRSLRIRNSEGSIRWLSYEELLQDTHAALASSWQGFSYTSVIAPR